MSESSSPSNVQPSSEVVRWLQSLALPLWARGVLVIVFLAVTLGGLGLVVWAAVNRDRESMTAAISLLTVALPVSLIVIGLVFGQRSERRLANITTAILDKLIPQQVQGIACGSRKLAITQLLRTGCRATYILTAEQGQSPLKHPLRFSVELNVRKVNVMFSVPDTIRLEGPLDNNPALLAYRHVISGAQAEGYRLNSELADYGGEDGGRALLFFRALPDDFLLRPIEKLYFTQDLGFFVRGILEAQEAAQPPKQ